jgi:hypothetical protein
MASSAQKEILLQALELEASLLEQLQLEKRVNNYSRNKYGNDGNITPRTAAYERVTPIKQNYKFTCGKHQQKSVTPKHNRKEHFSDEGGRLLKKSRSVPTFIADSFGVRKSLMGIHKKRTITIPLGMQNGLIQLRIN